MDDQYLIDKYNQEHKNHTVEEQFEHACFIERMTYGNCYVECTYDPETSTLTKRIVPYKELVLKDKK